VVWALFTKSKRSITFGDSINRTVTWKSGSDVSALAGKVVKLRFVLNDADLYAIRFE